MLVLQLYVQTCTIYHVACMIGVFPVNKDSSTDLFQQLEK